MEDNFGKYLRLFGTIFFTFIGFLLSFVILMLGIRVIFGALSYIPWFNYLFMIFILMFPTALFVSVYIIYFRRTAVHRSKIVRVISYSLFTIALLFWIYFFITDLLVFFKHFYNSIDMYNTYNLLFLASNVGAIFLVGIIQALSTEKEQDWTAKHRLNDDPEMS